MFIVSSIGNIQRVLSWCGIQWFFSGQLLHNISKISGSVRKNYYIQPGMISLLNWCVFLHLAFCLHLCCSDSSNKLCNKLCLQWNLQLIKVGMTVLNFLTVCAFIVIQFLFRRSFQLAWFGNIQDDEKVKCNSPILYIFSGVTNFAACSSQIWPVSWIWPEVIWLYFTAAG